jgi:hypothetical protein
MKINPAALSEAWLEYALEAMPLNALPIQQKETRRAFYAGAWIMLTILSQMSEDSFTQDEASAQIEACFQEALAFKTMVLRSDA